MIASVLVAELLETDGIDGIDDLAHYAADTADFWVEKAKRIGFTAQRRPDGGWDVFKVYTIGTKFQEYGKPVAVWIGEIWSNPTNLSIAFWDWSSDNHYFITDFAINKGQFQKALVQVNTLMTDLMRYNLGWEDIERNCRSIAGIAKRQPA